MADTRSRTPPEEKDEARTPYYLWHYIRSRWAPEIDLACTHANSLTPGYPPYECSMLDVPWHEVAKVGYCNPPYSNIWPWLEKALIERELGFTSIFCIPSLNGDGPDYLKLSANGMEHIIGRVNFLRPVHTKVPHLGMEMKGNSRGTSLFVYEGGKSQPMATRLSPVVTAVERDALIADYTNHWIRTLGGIAA